MMVETSLISQHLGVAASRLGGESGKLRLGLDDAEITSLLPAQSKCWSPGLSADRIAVALSLLSECGKLLRLAGPDGNVTYSRSCSDSRKKRGSKPLFY